VRLPVFPWTDLSKFSILPIRVPLLSLAQADLEVELPWPSWLRRSLSKREIESSNLSGSIPFLIFSTLITERTHAGTMARYSITVHTSDIPQSVAEGTGFAIMHGPSISSKEVPLARQSASTFHDGSEDTWTTCDMQDLGALQRLTIGLRDAVRRDQLSVSVQYLHPTMNVPLGWPTCYTDCMYQSVAGRNIHTAQHSPDTPTSCVSHVYPMHDIRVEV